MYKIQLPSGDYLEGQFLLTFELNNQVFSTSTTDVLPGTFSFPATIPLTDTNKALLNHPHLVTNSAQWTTYEGVWVELYGVKMFYGTLTITAATDLQASVNIVANPLKKMKGVKLNQLDLGGARGLGAFSDWLDLMKDTIDNPEDHDFVFVPIYHEGRNDYTYDVADPDRLSRPWWNQYDMLTEAFIADSGALVPFPKIEYVLQKIFAHEDTGFAFVNAWQTAEKTELRRIYLFNNWDMRELNSSLVPDVPDSIDLTNHVPAIASTELLRAIIAQYALGLFTNIFSRSIRLVPLQQILERVAKHDWTRYAVGRPALEDADEPPGIFNYEQPNELPSGVPAPESITTVFNTLVDFQDALPLADGFYYIETEHSIVEVLASSPFQPVRAWLQHRGVILDSDKERLDVRFTSLLHYNFSEYYNTPVPASRFYEEADADGNTTWERRRTDPPLALLAYRGYNDVGYANPLPCATHHVWNPAEAGDVRLDITAGGSTLAQAEHSLNWSGTYGLFQTWHRAWAYMLLTGKHCTVSLVLPVSLLVQFSFEDKIRIGEMEYFVKRLRVGKPLGRGRVLVEASLVSTI